jgi:hypothetical protein
MIDGVVSVGQYILSISMNLPSGAGSQLDSLSLPGELRRGFFHRPAGTVITGLA